MRSTVKNEESTPAEPAAASGPNGPRHRSGTPSSPVLGVIDPAARASTPPNLPPEWQNGRPQPGGESQGGSPEATGAWFRPRQRGRQQDAQPAQAGQGTEAAGAGAEAAARAGQEQLPAQEYPMPGQGAPGQELPGTPASPFAAGRPPRQGDAGFAPDAGRGVGRGPGQGAPFGAGGPVPNDPYSAAPYREAPADPFAPNPARNDPFAGNPAQGAPFAGSPAPGGRFAGGQAPADPFAPSPAQGDPFAPGPAQSDPFAPNPGQGGRFAGGPGQGDRFAGGPAQADPFAPGPGQADPFRTDAAAPRRQAAPRGTDSATGPAAPAGGPEDTQVGGFDPIGEDPQSAAISGLPAAGPFGAAPTGAPGTDPFAPGRPGPKGPSASDRARPFADGRPTQGRFAETPGFEPASPFPGAPGAAAAPGPSPFSGQPQGAGRAPGAPGFGSVPPDAEKPEDSQGPAAPKGDGDDKGKDDKGAQPKPASESAPAAKPRRGRGRKLATYAVGGVLFAGAAAYGTGLMLNQADIPKGTTVLGTEIGGDSRDQAVSMLDDSVGKAGQAPLKLKLGDQTVDLDPSTAGLSFDTTATVDGLTKHSYNPVQVIGSLKGGSTAVEPEVKVDRAKLKAALDSLGGKSSQGLQEGYVRFTADGQTEVVPGKAGQAVDANAAMDLIEQAYRDRAAGKPDAVVTVPVAAAQPKVTADALQAAADGLGKSVLNGTVSVYAGTKKFDFGKVTASQALTLAPDDSGKMALKWDLDKLNDALKKVAFDKVKIKKNGALVQVTPQDVAEGIASVIDKSAAKDRVYRFQI
ncbi:peptidoglycan binding domain-containing protein [Kitasatospora sp. NPDC056138]|uniref:peptidoglycan binding domain-containing protein n=1 Tax=Kitasatospora sp. NPDC056138 TaxID=3345724 RepID=UPI0035DB8CC6